MVSELLALMGTLVFWSGGMKSGSTSGARIGIQAAGGADNSTAARSTIARLR